jgi:hypothetical protein
MPLNLVYIYLEASIHIFGAKAVEGRVIREGAWGALHCLLEQLFLADSVLVVNLILRLGITRAGL